MHFLISPPSSHRCRPLVAVVLSCMSLAGRVQAHLRTLFASGAPHTLQFDAVNASPRRGKTSSSFAGRALQRCNITGRIEPIDDKLATNVLRLDALSWQDAVHHEFGDGNVDGLQ
uniref:Uncharacterized protein n=1 Tax=Schizaphis graminum TaxID=13262 RepID=A0A2S2N6R7_SCHGA